MRQIMIHSVKFYIIYYIICLCIKGIVAPYQKYFISNYCSSLRGSVIKIEDSGTSSAIMLKLKRETYRPNMECDVTFKAQPNFGIIASVKKVKLRYNYPYEDKLDVSSDNNNETSLKFFGTNEEESPHVNIISNLNAGEINVRFRSGNFVFALHGKGFRIVLTSFTLLSSNGRCGENSSYTLNCKNKRCISPILECDGFDNCGNNYDELSCGFTSESAIGLIVFGVTILAMALLILIFLCRSKISPKKISEGFSKAYNNKRLSVMISANRRFSVDTSALEQSNFPPNSEDLNSYASLPVIYSPPQDKAAPENR